MTWTGKNEVLQEPLGRAELEAMLDGIDATYTVKRVPAGAMVFWLDEPNQCRYYLVEGSVECFRVDAAGRTKVIDRYGPGCFFGYHILRDDCLPMSCARCCEDSRILAIPKESFFQLLHTCPEFTDRTVRYLFGLLSMQTREVVNQSFYGAAQRVPMLLAEMAHDCQRGEGASVPGTPTQPMVLPYSNNEVADMLGLSRNSVTTALSRLQSQGVIEKQRNSIRVLDIAKLEEIAQREQE